MTTVRILTAALMCSALALSACQKKAETPPADATAPAADATAPAGDAAMTPAGNTPAECQAYLDHVNACATKVAATSPQAAEAIRSSMEQTRTAWAQVSDQTAMAAACKQADDAFAISAKAQGC